MTYPIHATNPFLLFLILILLILSFSMGALMITPMGMFFNPFTLFLVLILLILSFA